MLLETLYKDNTINRLLTSDQKKNLEVFFESLNLNTRKNITTSKIVNAAQVTPHIANEVLFSLVSSGDLKFEFQVFCPHCDCSVKRFSSLSEARKYAGTCSYCDEDFDLMDRYIRVVFSVKNNARN